MAVVRTFNGTGADCSGSSGDSNRVLTLSNTGITQQSGFLVYASGLALSLTIEYTVNHKTESTELTFLNPLWDDMTVIIQYYENIIGVGSDFELGPLIEFGVEVTRTPVTTTRDNITGDKTYTDGTEETISVVFQNADTKYNLSESGLAKVFDARMWLKPAETINKYDKITYDGRIYRVDEVSTRYFNGNAMYKMATLFFVSD